ncbi:alpha/beta hydrolase family protein [Bacillus piscicola]|uniref:alpha/beta hydrolase family protein n=1 Tax=Bacillus piscicola TaxID=1632684 RepID=UPI001F08BD4C
MANLVEQRSFEIALGDNLYVRGNVHTPLDGSRSTRPVVIICHGFKGHKDWGFFPYAADYLAAQGFHAIRFNFSCNGVKETDFDELEKFAVNTFSRELLDLKALLEHIEGRNLPYADTFDLENIAIIGHSRGGGSALLFAAEHREIKAAVTWNGIWDVDFLGEEVKKEVYEKGITYIPNARTKQQMPLRDNFFQDIEENKDRFAILNQLNGMNIPVLTVQGEEDREWLTEGARKMASAAQFSQLMNIPGASHTFNAVHPFTGTTSELEQALESTTDFLKQRN